MTERTPGSHDIAPGGGLLGAKSTGSSEESPKVIYDASLTSLCSKCTVLDYLRMTSPGGQTHHSNWSKLKQSASLGCGLCKFFTLAPLHPKSSSRSTFYADSSGPLQFKICQLPKQKTTCLYICVPQDKRTAAIYYLYLTTERPEAIPRCQIRMSDSENDRLSLNAVKKVSTWIEDCRNEHRSCRWSIKPNLPTRVIDVAPADTPGCVRLVEGQGQVAAEYIALSHCWGNMPFNRYDLLSKCETVNIDSLQQGISKDLLPKLYQDAIDLTRALNKKYIWIDSLCIIQDSKEDWALECERMSEIYSNCYMTISAMSYENNSGGFRHIHPEDLPPRHPLCALPGHAGTTVNVRSMVDHTSRKDHLKYRGWAFQELLLSPRVLHLTSTAMAFECDTCTVLERGPDSDTLYGFDTNRKRFVFTTSREESLEGLQDAITNESSSSSSKKHYDRWLQLVQTYSQLKLTYNTDRLPALSGIAKHVASKTQDVYVAGLWQNDIAAGLLWYVWPYQSTAPKYIAPSWSWASTAAAWTLEPSRRRFVHLTVNHVQTKLATSNPYGEISAASLTVSGPLKQCSARQLVKKGHRYFALKADKSNSVRFALDTGHTRDLRPNTFWCLDCTTNKTLDIEMAQSTMRRETFFRPHGLVLACLDAAKQTYKRVGVFEVYCIDHEASAWQNNGFEMATIHII